jgi:hypothetical protein
MRKLGFFALLLLAGLWACEYENIIPIVVEVPDNVEFSVDVAPIFADVSCTGCHGGGISPNLTQGEAWDALVSGGFVDTDNPVGSKLILMINEGHRTSGDLSAEQKAYILKWITEGAKNN